MRNCRFLNDFLHIPCFRDIFFQKFKTCRSVIKKIFHTQLRTHESRGFRYVFNNSVVCAARHAGFKFGGSCIKADFRHRRNARQCLTSETERIYAAEILRL